MRFYRALLHLYPSGFRAEYGADMVGIFAERRRRTRGLAGVLALYTGAIWDVVHNAARVHADILRQDLRYTARTLLREPGYAATAIVITALGVGATTAAFSITDHVLIRPLAFADAGRLVKLWENQPQYSRMELSPANYRDWKAQSTSFDGMAGFSSRPANLAGGREPQRLETILVDADLFSVLGASPAIGRVFAPEDDHEGAAGTLVVSHALWQSEFGADPAVLGRVVRLDDESYTVIGVMAPDFTFPNRETQVWRPFRFRAADFQDRTDDYLQAVAKLKPDVSIDQARAELTTITEQLERRYPKENSRTRATVIPLRGELSPQTRLLLTALFGASLSVLLIACTNLASLLLTRVLGRRCELAVRTALGAGRERLVRQLLTESVLLSALGGVIGVAIAVAAMPLLARLVPLTLPMGEPTVDLRVLLFATLVTCGTGLGFGIIPALRVCRRPDMTDLREGMRSATSGRGQRLRAALVVAQVTVSVALLISSGLLIRALWRVQAVDPGFVTRDVLAIQTPVPWPKYAPTSRRVDFYNRVLSETRTLPGVSSAAFISFVPMAMGGGIWPIVIQGAPALPADTEQSLTASMRFVTPDFFTTLGIALRRGRDVRESDTTSSQMVAVVSESFVRRYWPEGDPIGRSFTMALSERTVVGVVGDIRVRGLERPSEPQVYLPYRQVADGWFPFYAPKELVVRSSGDPATLTPAIRRIVREADPDLPLARIRTLQEVVETQTAPRVTQLRVLQAFAVLSLLLAGIGIHGLLSYAVSQRRAEIGLRVALGAQRSSILKLVLGQGVLLATLGAILGIGLAYIAGEQMKALLAGVGPGDPATFIAAAGLAILMTVGGSLLPALRALRVEAASVMRG
jgi:predicted permease